MMTEAERFAKTDIGPPYFWDMLPQVIKDNYGKWLYHEKVKPGVLKHVGETGDELYTVRVGSPRLLSIETLIEDIKKIMLLLNVKTINELKKVKYQFRK